MLQKNFGSGRGDCRLAVGCGPGRRDRVLSRERRQEASTALAKTARTISRRWALRPGDRRPGARQSRRRGRDPAEYEKRYGRSRSSADRRGYAGGARASGLASEDGSREEEAIGPERRHGERPLGSGARHGAQRVANVRRGGPLGRCRRTARGPRCGTHDYPLRHWALAEPRVAARWPAAPARWRSTSGSIAQRPIPATGSEKPSARVARRRRIAPPATARRVSGGCRAWPAREWQPRLLLLVLICGRFGVDC